MDLNKEKNDFRQTPKELNSDGLNYLGRVRTKAQELHDVILEGGTNRTVDKALDRLQECMFWVENYRLK